MLNVKGKKKKKVQREERGSRLNLSQMINSSHEEAQTGSSGGRCAVRSHTDVCGSQLCMMWLCFGSPTIRRPGTEMLHIMTEKRSLRSCKSALHDMLDS